ncbi:MAG TPA: zf-HC2 domain-containing protein [Terriglobales bacterium]|nr:zf-HC2 domain-containing protein [Terriglobales bacterium]
MKCSKAQRAISEYVDGALDTRRAAELERHVAVCPACREVLADFRGMKDAAAGLEAPEPDPAVWRKIEARMTSGAAAAGPADPVRVPGRWAFGPSVPGLKLAGVAALALVLVASGLYVGLRMGGRGAARYPKNSEKYTLAKLDEAEAYYRKAIRSLGEAFAAGKGAMIPQAAEMFDRNLAVIDATIQACREAVRKSPDDLEARNYLLAAYMDKLTFLDTALEFSRKNPGAMRRGKSL